MNVKSSITFVGSSRRKLYISRWYQKLLQPSWGDCSGQCIAIVQYSTVQYSLVSVPEALLQMTPAGASCPPAPAAARPRPAGPDPGGPRGRRGRAGGGGGGGGGGPGAGGGGHTMTSLHPPTWYILQFRRRLLLSSSSESSSNTGETIRIYIESFSTNS